MVYRGYLINGALSPLDRGMGDGVSLWDFIEIFDRCKQELGTRLFFLGHDFFVPFFSSTMLGWDGMDESSLRHSTDGGLRSFFSLSFFLYPDIQYLKYQIFKILTRVPTRFLISPVAATTLLEYS